jgi:hypothetical protein
MATQLGWEPLQVRRVKIRLLLLFKTQHNLVAIPAEAYLLPSDSRTRGQNTFRIPSTRKDVYQNSFFPRSIRDWNNLPSAADKSPAGQYLQLKTGGYLIYTVRNWAGGKLPSMSLNSSTELAVVAADGRLFQSRMDLGKKEFR